MTEFIFRKHTQMKVYESDGEKDTLMFVESFPEETHIWFDKYPLTDDYESMVAKAKKYDLIRKMLDMDDEDFMHKFLLFKPIYWEDIVDE